MEVETKICRICKEEKALNQYYSSKVNKDGFVNSCKTCVKIITKKNRLKNPEKYNEHAKRWRDKNREKANENSKNWRLSNPEKMKQSKEKYRTENSEKVKESYKIWADINREKLQEQRKEWYNKNKEYANNWRHKNCEKANEYGKNWRLRNPEKVNKKGKNRIEQLKDSYIRPILKKNSNLKTEDIPPDLIELKRIIIKTKRLIKELSNEK